MDGPGGRLKLPLLLVLAVAGLLFFSRLDLPLLEPQEARYAEIPRQMLDSGDWLTPVLHGQPYFDKPPLLYWLVMGCYSVFGVHDWAARLVPGMACLLTVLVTYLWGRRVVGERTALAGALVLCLSGRYLYLGRMLSFDTLLCLFVTASLASAHFRLMTGERRWWLLSALMCGLGVLTKGPVALVLVVVPVLAVNVVFSGRFGVRRSSPLWIFLFFLRETKGHRPQDENEEKIPKRRGSPHSKLVLDQPTLRDWLLYLLVVGLTAGPWFVFMALKHPEFVEHFFWQHHVVRFVAPFDHEEPFWFHVPGVLLGMLPWTLLLPGLMHHQRRRSRRMTARRPAALGFFLLAAGWGLFFFSLSGCKRAVYILPVLPPLALALGCYLDVLLRFSRTKLPRPATLLMLILGAGGSVTAAISGLLTWPIAVMLAIVALILVAALAWSPRRVGWLHCFLATFAILYLALHVLMPAYHERFAMRHCLDAYRHENSEDVPIACYPRGWDSISFYLRRDDVRIYSPEQRTQLLDDLQSRPRTLLFLKAGRTADEFLRHLPDTMAFAPRRSTGSVIVGWVYVGHSLRECRPGHFSSSMSKSSSPRLAVKRNGDF
jgi:4-amino-4-deoxy-L-arabinose transferase-like glycosyltransferase